jgi:hypothetical protein
MTKRSILVLRIILIIAVVGYCHVNGQTEDQKTKERIRKFIACVETGNTGLVDTYYLEWNLYTKIQSPEEDEVHQIHMTWNSSALGRIAAAFKNFDYKKGKMYNATRLSIHIYDKKLNSILIIGVANDVSAILIDNESYEATPEVMQSLKYLMPYLAYEQISQSTLYEKYFIETKDKSKEVDSNKSDPNSVTK